MLLPSVFSGEWQTRFNPHATSKGVFYVDSQKSVAVDMMKAAQYPIHLLQDPELGAQVPLRRQGMVTVYRHLM